MISETETLPPPHWKLVGIDETRHWGLSPEKMARVKKFIGVYLFDANRRVRCCELTPSYELYPIGTEVEFVDDELDEYKRDEIHQDVITGDSQCHSVTYFHTHVVDDAIAGGQFPSHDFGPDEEGWWRGQVQEHGNENLAWEASLEAMVDHCRANSYI